MFSRKSYSIEGPDCDLVWAVMDMLESEVGYWRAMYQREHRLFETHMHVAHIEDDVEDELLAAAQELGIDVTPQDNVCENRSTQGTSPSPDDGE